MRRFGFSTGALTRADFRQALEHLSGHNVAAVELSALRDTELDALLSAMGDLTLSGYEHVSVHIPSKFEQLSEEQVHRLLTPLAEQGVLLVAHPDVLTRDELWQRFGSRLCLENMDKRKPIGRTAHELQALFTRFPEACLCLDLAHCRQVDPTMIEARRILMHHGQRLRQVHLSDVNSACAHEPLNRLAIEAYRKIAPLLADEVPVILESPVAPEHIARELQLASQALPSSRVLVFA